MAETSGAERLTAALAASSGAGSRAEPVCISSANYTGATPRQRRESSSPACGGAASGGAERQSERGVKSGISRRMRRDLAVLEGKKKKKRTMVRTEREQREQEGEPPAPPVPPPFLVDTSAGRSAVRGDHATPEVPSATPHPPSQPRSGFSAQQLFYCMKCDVERQMLAPASASELACPVCGIAMNSRPGGLR